MLVRMEIRALKIAAVVLTLVLAMVLEITLAVATPVLADTRIPDYSDFTINNRGIIIEGGDVVLGKCTTLLKQRDKLSTKGPRGSIGPGNGCSA